MKRSLGLAMLVLVPDAAADATQDSPIDATADVLADSSVHEDAEAAADADATDDVGDDARARATAMELCGCDGTTYDNSCKAHRDGLTSVDHSGSCP